MGKVVYFRLELSTWGYGPCFILRITLALSQILHAYSIILLSKLLRPLECVGESNRMGIGTGFVWKSSEFPDEFSLRISSIGDALLS